jgi:integrase
LCQDILIGIQRANKIAEQWKANDYSTDVESLFPSCDIIYKKDVAELTSDDSKTLSGVIDHYTAEFQGSWTPKSKSEIVDDSLVHFLEIVGDVAIQQISRKKVSAYKQILIKLPPRYKTSKKYKDKSINQLLAMDVKETLAPRTVNKHLGRVSTFFDWAKRNGYYEGENPASDMNVPLSADADDSRAPYSLNDLTSIFSADGYVKDSFSRSYMFWTPIIGLFHGMRQNEIAQLHLKDIRKEKGVWVFDVNDLETKQVKTASSNRLVPIHPFLIEELGFLKTVEKLKKAGHDRLFPEITKGRDGYGQTVSKWYNERFRPTIKFESDPKERRKDFHSSRTTFITHLAYKDIPDKKIKQLAGHSRGSDVTNRNYIEVFPGDQLLKDVMMKVDFHKLIDLTHLKSSKYVVK